ncbi:unnamed protein product [Pleuronectes platessa]|uniref:Endonuclease VIII-like 1 DNA binding domain-containing protein n=1 Tax=Pleuronectes platessa TaxID=8262 RepID=A0A9N7VBX4_PLEPL|nr:unnamed protein product [Pleuronectes platessa]
MFEYKSFRENVVSHLSDRAFDRPICETLLNQKYFNGIGNYLRAEILFRLNIPPFVPARTVLEGLESEDSCESGDCVKKENTKKSPDGAKTQVVKEEAADLLRLCHTVPLEVVNQGGKGYDPEKADYSDFKAWLQCYYVDGMKSIRDHNGRTMWFNGDPGPMAPKDPKSPKAKRKVKKEDDHDYTQKKKVAKSRSESTPKKKVVKQETAAKTPKKEKDARPQEARIKNEKTLSVKVKRETTENARSRKSSPAGVLRRSCRSTRQNSK